MPGGSSPSLPPGRGDRVLAAALLASLAIHALILLPAGAPPAPAGSVTLHATLHEAPAAPAVPAALPPSPAAAVAPPQDMALPEPVERTYPRPAAAGRAETAAENAPAADVSAPADAGGPPSAEAAALPSPRPVIDLNGLRQYHTALSRAAARFRNYPTQARRAGWEGQVVLRLSVSETGAPTGLELIGSSGHPILDQAAIEMMGLAAGHTPVPESLHGRAFSIDLAARYNLTDEP